MDAVTAIRRLPGPGLIPPHDAGEAVAASETPLTAEGQAALAAAQVMARKSAAASTLRAYKADWTHFAALVRQARLCPCSRRTRNRGRLPRQSCRQPRAHHHPPAPVRAGQDAPLQRPAVEPRAPRHPGAAAGRAAHATAGRCEKLPPSRCPCCANCLPLATALLAAGATAHCCCLASSVRCAAPRWFLSMSKTSPLCPVGCGCASAAEKPIRPGRGRRSACRAAAMRKPARCARSRPGRQWRAGRLARCFAKSVPEARSEKPRCIQTRFGESLRIAWPWPASALRASTG